MAIDPSISLQFKTTPFDYAASMQKGMNVALTQQQIAQSQQEIEASKAAQANTEAALPGVQGVSQSQVTKGAADARDFSIKTQLGANGDKFQTTDPTTGAVSLDHGKMVAYLQSIGAADKVPEVATDYLKNATTAISNATSQNALDVAHREQGNKGASILAQEVLGRIAQGQTIGQVSQFYKTGRDGLKQQLGAGAVNENSLPESPEDLAVWAKSKAAGNVTAQEAIQNKQRDKEIAIVGMNANTSYQNMLQGGATVAQAQGTLKQASDNEFANSSFFNIGADMGKKMIGTGYAKTAKLYMENVANNPAYAPYVGAVAKYNQENGTNYIGNEAGIPDLLIEAGQKHHVNGEGQFNTYKNTLNPKMTSVPQKNIPQVNTKISNAPTDSIGMIYKGKQIQVSKDHVDAMSRNGATLVK